MIPIIMQIKIKLAESQKEYKEVSLKVQRLIAEIQSLANPYFGDDVELIHAEEIEQAGDEMIKYKTRLCELKAQIAQFQRDLG